LNDPHKPPITPEDWEFCVSALSSPSLPEKLW